MSHQKYETSLPTSSFSQRVKARKHRRRSSLESLEDRRLLACRALPFTTNGSTFDQCITQSFVNDGTTYDVTTYFTEGTGANDLADDGVDGTNANAQAMADESEDALDFYLDRGIDTLPSGDTELEVFITQEPRLGTIISLDSTWDSVWIDASTIDDNDVLMKRLLAYHEIQHLVQARYDSTPDWGLYGEGTARAIEDRVDAALDADTGHLFIPEVNGVLTTDANRRNDIYTQSYRSVLWWTWLMDQYRDGNGVDPPVTNADDLGWGALRDIYEEINSMPEDEIGAVNNFIVDQGSTFRDDFVDYTLALWAHKYNPADARLGFIDTEIVNNTSQLSGHNTHAVFLPVATDAVNMNVRSSRYWEFNPASQCDFTAFTFDGGGNDYAFSVMTEDGGNLVDRWTSFGNEWARTVRTVDLDSIVGVVSAVDDSGNVDVGHGCVTPSINIVSPTTSNHKMVGRADNPRTFIVRLDVDGQDGSAISGLTSDAFNVWLRKTSDGDGGVQIAADVVNAAYVQEDYWLVVQAPDDTDGAETGEFYDLTVELGAVDDIELGSILYVERTQDVMLVLDRSGSMGGGTGKIEAAQNAATMLVDELADDDQGAFIAFSDDADLRVQLDEVGNGGQRDALLTAIANENAGGTTSIGDGMDVAAIEHDAAGIDLNMCSFVLLSDGMENESQFWADVSADVIDNGCEIHTVALGPSANQDLLQQIAGASSAGGTFYYATNEGTVPINSVIGWENNLSRIYDAIATDVAGRQRIVTAVRESAVGGAISGMVPFDDLERATKIAVGQTVKSGGVEITGKRFVFVPGQFTDEGYALITDQLDPGQQFDAAMGNINLEFDFGGRVERLALLFGEFGGVVNLEVNDELVIAQSLMELDGASVGGAKVSVELIKGGGRLVVDGPVEQFAIGGQEFAIDEVVFKGDGYIEIPVDDRSDELVVSVGWQQDSGGTHRTILIDPNGNLVPTALRKVSTRGVNDVWRVPKPIHGNYRLNVLDLNQEFFVTGSVISRYELETFIGTPQAAREQGVQVPIVASFVVQSQPIQGASVVATITAPDGHRQAIKLYDDGNHGDGEPNDGLYGNTYFGTSQAGVVAPPPEDVVDGQEPEAVGSYVINTVAVKDDVRREAQDSFVIRPGRDLDRDGISDIWEETHGLNPKDRADAQRDPDMDGLSSLCEYQLGTNPFNNDTDGGGENDGSEVRPGKERECRVGDQDPNDPSDDRVRAISAVFVHAEATANGTPYMDIAVSTGILPSLMVLMRRAFDDRGRLVEDWITVSQQMSELTFVDRQVESGLSYQYKVMPTYEIDREKLRINGRNVHSAVVQASSDPYAPVGHIIIGDRIIVAQNGEGDVSRFVDLYIDASDLIGGHHDTIGDEVSGSPQSRLLMRVSNTPDFAESRFQPYVPVIEKWRLNDDVRVGELAHVYLQLKDEAGNISEGLHQDSILITDDFGEPGDLNGDNIVNALDIDVLSSAIRGGSDDLWFDIDGNRVVDQADHRAFVNDVLGTHLGDANLDGRFDSDDFVTVFIAGKYLEGIAGNVTWDEGDWNGDGVFDQEDLVDAFIDGGYVHDDAKAVSVAAAIDAAFADDDKDRSRKTSA